MAYNLNKYISVIIVIIIVFSVIIIQTIYSYEKRTDKVTQVALTRARINTINLLYSGNTTERFILELKQYNCSPGTMWQEDRVQALYYISKYHNLAYYTQDLESWLYTAYIVNGLEIPWKLTLGLENIYQFFLYMSQNMYQYMVTNKRIDCNKLPDYETLQELNQVFDILNQELEDIAYNKNYEFNGLDMETIEYIYNVSSNLSTP